MSAEAKHRYVVLVDDNFHYMDESERFRLGEFADCASAIAACKELVDEGLSQNRNRTATEILTEYLMFGDDPWIQSDDSECRFSARDYARERVKELALVPEPDPSTP